MKFIGVLALLAVLGFLGTIRSTIEYSSTRRAIIKALSLVTITVPPALPAAMSIGIVFALARLRRNQIYCIAPQRINVAGRVKTIVFDKTGTLTEDSLKFSGVTVALKDTFSDLETDIESFQEAIANDSDDPHLQEIKQK